MIIYLFFLYLKVKEASHKKNRKEKVFAAANNKDFRNFMEYRISHNRKEGKNYYSCAVISGKYPHESHAYNRGLRQP